MVRSGVHPEPAPSLFTRLIVAGPFNSRSSATANSVRVELNRGKGKEFAAELRGFCEKCPTAAQLFEQIG